MIGVPGFDGVQAECQENFFGFAFRCGRDLPEYDFLLKIIVKKEQFRARNNLVNMAIANSCDYLLMLDDDMLVPTDLLQRLLTHDKDVTGALYWQRGGAYHPVLIHLDEKPDGEFGMRFYSPFDEVFFKRGLYQVDAIGGGCMLFKTEVFNKLTPPYFWWEATEGTDIGICRRLGEAGVEIWCDTSIELGHLGEKQIVTSRTIPQYHAEIGQMKELLFADLCEYFGMSQEQVEAEALKAGQQEMRQEKWFRHIEAPRLGGATPRNPAPMDWSEVRAFYQDPDPWAVFNLAYWAARSIDASRRFALTEMSRLVPDGGRILDYGPGIGLTTIELAKQGYFVTAVDIAQAPTLEFLKWRVKRHGIDDQVEFLEIEEPNPNDPLGYLFDAALMISVLDHLWRPYDVIYWIHAHLRPGCPLICDWESMHQDDEPQHIIHYDQYTFQKWMREHDFRCSPEKTWLFFKRDYEHAVG